MSIIYFLYLLLTLAVLVLVIVQPLWGIADCFQQQADLKRKVFFSTIMVVLVPISTVIWGLFFSKSKRLKLVTYASFISFIVLFVFLPQEVKQKVEEILRESLNLSNNN